MNYQEAEKIRGKGFSSTMTDKLLGGAGIGESFKSTLSEKTKAMGMGIKQKFDPMNIAKKLTFGSNLAPALLGKMTGRSMDDISFFAGKKQKNKIGKSAAVSGVAIDFATQILGDIYKILIETEEDRKLADDLEKDQEEGKQDELDRRNNEIIAAITGRRRKKPTKREEAKKKKEEVKKKKQDKRAEETKKTEPTKPGAKPTAKPEVKPTTTKPASKISTTSNLPTYAKVAGGVAAVGTAAAAIAGAESGGSYEITFGDRIDRKTGNVVRGKNMSPEQRFGKKLTDLTLEEVDILGKERNKQTMNTSATGKYQFMNRTLFGGKDKKGVFRPGLVQQLGLDPKTTKYTPEIQDKLFELLHQQDVQALKKLGVPLTPGYEYMAHYIGASGAAAVYKARNTNMTVTQAIVSAGLPDPSKSNEELLRIRAADFEGILQSRLEKKGGMVVHASQQSNNLAGAKIESSSQENQQLKKDLNAQKQIKQITNNEITTNTNKSSGVEQDPGDDSSAYARKAKGKG